MLWIPCVIFGFTSNFQLTAFRWQESKFFRFDPFLLRRISTNRENIPASRNLENDRQASAPRGAVSLVLPKPPEVNARETESAVGSSSG
jgi:hypothetical protein